MANEKEPLPTRSPQPVERRQASAESDRPSGRSSLRGSGTMVSRFGSLADIFKRKSESGDKASDKFRKAATDKNRIRQESVLEQNNLSMKTAVLLQEEQNDLLRQIIDQLKGHRPSSSGDDDSSLDVDLDRRNRGRGRRGRFGSKGRERLRRIQAARREKQFQRIRGAASRSYTAVRKAAISGAERVRAAAKSVAERIRPPSAPRPATLARPPAPDATRPPATQEVPRPPATPDATRPPATPPAPAAAVGQPSTDSQTRTVGGRQRIITPEVKAAASGLGRALGPVAVVLSGYAAYSELEDLYGLRTTGEITEDEFRKEFSRVVGGLAGGAGGALLIGKVGAALGAASGAVAAGVGAVPGAFIGGITGAIVGGLGGSAAGEELGERIYRYILAPTPETPPPSVLGGGADAAAVDDSGSFGLEPGTPPATQVQPPPAAAPAPRTGNMLSRLFSRSSPRQTPVLGQGGEAAAVGDAGAMGLERPTATRQVVHTQRELQFLRTQVESILTFRNQPDRTEEVMQHMTQIYSNRNIPMHSGLLRARIFDYIQLNPGPRNELLERAGQALHEGGQRTLQSLEQQQSGAAAPPPPEANRPPATQVAQTQAPPVESQQAQQQVVTTPAQKVPMESEPQQAAEPRPDTQNLVTRLSSGPAAPMPKSSDDYKTPSEPMVKSPVTTMAKDTVNPTNSIQSLLSILSDTKFNEIKIEAEKFEFDGRVSLSAAEAGLVTRTAAPFRGQGDLVPEMSRMQSPSALSSMGSMGGGGQSSAPGPSQAGGAAAEGTGSMGGATDSGSTGSGGGGSASPVSTSPASPAVSGGSAGTTGSSEGAISQVIQAEPGFNVVQYDDGRIERRTGSRNWRNNNPGNLEFGDFSRRYGALGSDGRFAIFPTYEAGQRAKEALLFEGRGYAGMTIAQAITRYAPPNENDTAMYIRTVSAAVGASPTTLMSDLNPDQRKALLASMERVEGFRVGRVDVVQSGTAVASAAGAQPVSGTGLAKESAGMAAADQAQTMGAGQQVVVQLPPRQESEQQRIAPTAAAQAARGEVPLNIRLQKQVA